MPQSLRSVRTFIDEDVYTPEIARTGVDNRSKRRRSLRFLEMVGQIVAPPRCIRIEISLADTTNANDNDWEFYPLE